MQDVNVFGFNYTYTGISSKFKLTLPVDLCQSVEEVRLINDYPNLSNFESNVLSLVENEKKVLIIHLQAYSHKEKYKLVKSKLPQDSFIAYGTYTGGYISSYDKI